MSALEKFHSDSNIEFDKFSRSFVEKESEDDDIFVKNVKLMVKNLLDAKDDMSRDLKEERSAAQQEGIDADRKTRETDADAREKMRKGGSGNVKGVP